LKNLLQEIKIRKIKKWLTIYISTAITTIGVTHLLSLRYHWPNYIFDIVFFTLLFGIFGTTILAWFHGEEGRQKVTLPEILLQSILAILLIVTLYTQVDLGTGIERVNNSKVVAVLPFANINETTDSEFFADGITDDVLNQLSKISDLQVISRTSVMKYKNTELNIPEISRELGAGTILEGSVRTYGNKVRIIGQLIDANNDVHIWSETYDRELEDVFDIQSDIAARIAAALHAKLLPLEKELIENKSTVNFDAYTFYLKGKHHYYNYTKEENEKAIEFYKKALIIDSTYALALSGLSEAYGQRVSKYWFPNEWIDSALALSKKALSINPNLPEAYKALASSYQGKTEYKLALHNYQKAIELNPNYWSAILNYGQIKTFTGNHDEAIYFLRRANELTPDDIMGNISLSMVYKNLNCDSSAIYWCKKALSLEPNHLFANSFLGDLYSNIGDYENANWYFKKSIEIDSNWVFGWFMGGNMELTRRNYKLAKEYYDNYMRITETSPEFFYAHALLNLNQADSAKVILEKEVSDYIEFFAETSTSAELNDYIGFAEIYAINGDMKNAFKWLKEAIDNGFTEINRVQNYPFFDDFRTEPEYVNLLTTIESKIDSFKSEAQFKYPEYFDCK